MYITEKLFVEAEGISREGIDSGYDKFRRKKFISAKALLAISKW